MSAKSTVFFKKIVHQKQFLRNGFVILNFDKINEIDRLKEVYESTVVNSSGELYASHNANSFEKNVEIDKEVRSATKEFLHKNFVNVDYLLGHFMVKAKGYHYEMPLHQDWNITDESKNFATNIWIPLQDVIKENGALFVIPGSHLFFNNFRSGSLDLPRIPRDKILDKLIVPIELKKGQAFVYSQGLFHGSFPNSSNQDRLAVVMSIIEKGIGMSYFHTEDRDSKKKEVEVFPISPEIILKELHLMEKGLAPESVKPKKKIIYDHINCSSIDSKELRNKSRFFSKMLNLRRWKSEIERFQLK